MNGVLLGGALQSALWREVVSSKLCSGVSTAAQKAISYGNSFVSCLRAEKVHFFEGLQELSRRVIFLWNQIARGFQATWNCIKSVVSTVARVAQMIFFVIKETIEIACYACECLVKGVDEVWKSARKFYADVSNLCYGATQRTAALMLPSQRYRFSWFKMRELKTTFETAEIKVSELDTHQKFLNRTIFYPFKIQGTSNLTLEGILMGQVNNIIGSVSLEGVKGPLVIVYPGIGGCYQIWARTQLLKLYRDYNRATLLMVNYRGVGYSQGYVTKPQDLFDDGMAIARFAQGLLKSPEKTLGKTPSQLLHFYGYSMGGAVTTHVVSSLEKLDPAWHAESVTIDRSYSSLGAAVFEAMPYFKGLFSNFTQYAGWNIDSKSAALGIKRSPMRVINDKKDGVIGKASLAEALLAVPQFPKTYPLFTLVIKEGFNRPSLVKLPIERSITSQVPSPGVPGNHFSLMLWASKIKLCAQRHLEGWRVWYQEVSEGIENHQRSLNLNELEDIGNTYHGILSPLEV